MMNTFSIKTLIYWGCLFLLLTISAQAADYPRRWIFVRNNLSSDSDITFLKNIVEEGKKAGFNGLVLTSLWDVAPKYFSPSFNARALWLKELCTANSFDLIPCGFSPGYGMGENYSAAFPVNDIRHKVENSKSVPLANSLKAFYGFENYNTATSSSSFFIDYPGKVSFIDKQVTHTGASSLRFENFTYNGSNMARFCPQITVTPYTSYEVSFWCKSENLPQNQYVGIQVYSPDGSRNMIFSWTKGITNEWQKLSLEFNSLEFDKLRLWCGLWGATTGKIWIDDIRIEQSNKISSMMVSRDGTDISVKNTNTGYIFTKNVDYKVDFNEASQEYYIQSLNNDKIKNGDSLKISYFRYYKTKNNQISMCMSNPALYDYWKEAAKMTNNLINPKAYFLSMDEIRQGGYCNLCKSVPMGRILGNCITKVNEMIKVENPSADVLCWGDMLDPNIGAVKNYCMTRDGFEKSWEYIPKTVIPVVWYYNKRDAGLAHFTNNGFKTFASVCVDSSDYMNQMTAWKTSLSSNNSVIGIMYTTWTNDYSKLKEFGEKFF